MSCPNRQTACDNDYKDAGTSRSMGCQAHKGGNNDGAGNPRNIPCNHAGLAWSTFPRPSPSPQSIALSLAQELDVLSQDGYSSNAYIPRQTITKPHLHRQRQRHSTDINGSGSVISAVAAGGEGPRVEPRQLRRTISSVSQSLSLPHVGRLHFP